MRAIPKQPHWKVPNRIKGAVFAFTGAIKDWPRVRKLYPLIRRNGGEVVHRAGGLRKAHCLVHGDIYGSRKTTQKLGFARKNGIPVISEDAFFGIVRRERHIRK